MDAGNRLHERALALPVLGFVLLTPPVLAIFGRAAYVLGVPVSYAYIFGVWLGLIGLGAALARRLPDSAARRGAGGPDPSGSPTAAERAAPDAPTEG